jgi:hypothetical protein
MDDSIRQYLRRRVWTCGGVMLCGWLMVAAGGSLARQLPAWLPVEVLPVLGFILFGGGVVALQLLVRCPSCRARLGQTIAMPMAFNWGSGARINFCPFCGINLDTPLPQADGVGHSHNPIHPG